MKKLLNIAAFIAIVWALLLTTSCTKEKDLPTPAVEPVVIIAPVVLDMNLHVGTWDVDSIYYHYRDGSGYNFTLNQGTQSFTGSIMTWETSNTSAYNVDGNFIIIPSDATDLELIALSTSTMHYKLTNPGNTHDIVEYYMSK